LCVRPYNPSGVVVEEDGIYTTVLRPFLSLLRARYPWRRFWTRRDGRNVTRRTPRDSAAASPRQPQPQPQPQPPSHPCHHSSPRRHPRRLGLAWRGGRRRIGMRALWKVCLVVAGFWRICCKVEFPQQPSTPSTMLSSRFFSSLLSTPTRFQASRTLGSRLSSPREALAENDRVCEGAFWERSDDRGEKAVAVAVAPLLANHNRNRNRNRLLTPVITPLPEGTLADSIILRSTPSGP
jgi:hypothetical protein